MIKFGFLAFFARSKENNMTENETDEMVVKQPV